jgi:hypothetical protein
MKKLLVAVVIVRVMDQGGFPPGGSFTTTQLQRGGALTSVDPGTQVFGGSPLFRLQPVGCEAVIARVRLLDRMNYRVGYGLAPGEFFMLSQECLRSGTTGDFRRLLADGMPLVRVMGLISLAQSVKTAELAAVATSMSADTAVVTYTNGCVLDLQTTVSDIAAQLAEGRFFLAGEGQGHR